MGVTHRGIGDEEALFVLDPLGEAFGSFFEEDFAGAFELDLGLAAWDAGSGEGFGGAPVFGSGVAVDGDVGEVVEEFGGAVAFGGELEEARLGVDEFGVGVAGAESLVGNDVLEEGNIGLDAADAEFAEGAIGALAGGFEVTAHGGEFDQHGVVVRRDDGTGVAVAGVETDAEAGSGAVVCDAAVVGCEAFLGIFGGDAALDGVAIAGNVFLGGNADLGLVKFVALGDENLGANEVDAGDAFGHGVLDLNARVHFDEEPLLGIHVVEEFDGAGVVIADGFGKTGSGFAEVVTEGSREVDGRGDFDDLLVAALDGAVALVKVDDVAVTVAEDLDFDVLGAFDVAFEEDRVVAKGVLRFFLGFFEAGLKLGGFFDNAHAAPATTEGGFDDEREANFMGHGEGLVGIGNGVVGSWKDGDLGGDGLGASGGFVAHGAEEVGGGPDEGDAFAFTSAGEIGVFREEAVAGVNEGDALGFGDGDNAFVVEISSDGSFGGIEGVGFIGLKAMAGEAIFFGVDGDGFESEFGGGAEDADGDFATVCYEKFLCWCHFDCLSEGTLEEEIRGGKQRKPESSHDV